MAEIEFRYPTFPRGPNTPNTLVTHEPPRFRDAYSFSGIGRTSYQHANVDPVSNLPAPVPPIVPMPEALPDPGEPRG